MSHQVLRQGSLPRVAVAFSAAARSAWSAAFDSFGPDALIPTERLLAVVRGAAIVVTASVLPFISLENRGLAALIVLFGACYTAAIVLVIVPIRPQLLNGGYLTSVVETGMVSTAVALTGGYLSPFFVIYYPLTTVYGLRFGRNQMLWSPGLACICYLVGISVSGTAGEAEWGVVAFRMFWLTVTGILAGLISERLRGAEIRLETELRRTRALLQAAYAPAASLTLNGVLGAVVHHSRLLTEADCAAVLVYSQ